MVTWLGPMWASIVVTVSKCVSRSSYIESHLLVLIACRYYVDGAGSTTCLDSGVWSDPSPACNGVCVCVCDVFVCVKIPYKPLTAIASNDLPSSALLCWIN